MKFFKYIIIVTIFALTSVAYCASDTTSTANTQTEQKELTAEELHQKQQEELDKQMVEKVEEIRGRLKRFVAEVRKVSPATADLLVQRYFNVTVIQYIISLLILGFGYALTKYVINFIFGKLLSLFEKRGKNSFAILFISKIRRPVSIVAWVVALYYMLAFLVKDPVIIAMLARLLGIVFWGSVCWGAMIVSDSAFGSIETKFRKKSSGATASLLGFINRVVKITIITIAILSALAHCGINVNTIIASLGIGGMALAFASQDTIANFFGSVSIILDRPFIVGDWIKTNSVEGTVEAIGFRSTRIRTFSKTVVTIPNSIMAKETIENFSKMPVRRVVQMLGFTYDATPEQIDNVLPILRKRIPKIEGVDVNSGITAEFDSFGASSLDIRLVYYTKVDYATFMATKRRVNLEIMRIAKENGLSFAFPSISVYNESTKETK